MSEPLPEIAPEFRGVLCGVWVGQAGTVHLCSATPGGGRVESKASYRPFAWFRSSAAMPSISGLEWEELRGPGPFNRLAHGADEKVLDELEQAVGKGGFDDIRPLESQFLMQQRARLYADLHFRDLRRCQLDIETSSEDGSFSDASRPGDRVLAIGLRQGGVNRILELESLDDAAEARLLLRFNEELRALDPDVIEGHNIFRFDLDFLRQRARRHKVPCAWGRFGQKAGFRNSRLKVAERWVDFPRCDLPGRAVVDTYLLTLLHDISTRELGSYGLKEVAIHLGITAEASEERTYVPGGDIFRTWREDRERFRAYLSDDLRETEGIASLLLPTYFEQTRSFPILLQEALLRGTTTKIDLLFLEEYYHARHACPVPPEVQPFEGGYTRSFKEGVFERVLHFDVASLYPSLLLHIGRDPANDPLGVFIPLLRSLREYRLRFKQVARNSTDPEERSEAQARQSSFKILINSFYGYLGFSGARFGDGALAAEVTRQGRELLQRLIAAFESHGGLPLEADTDGIYLSSERHYTDPDGLLALVRPELPPGIELEYDGRYERMFCYKAKNYALREGGRLILRGSALRSRGMEPFLKRLTDETVRYLLEFPGVENPAILLDSLRREISSGSAALALLAKSELLSSSPESYEQFIAGGGKPRRASAEVALRMIPRPRMGDRISYYITAKQRGAASDWQRARPVLGSGGQHPLEPYDPSYYLEKLEDWSKRLGPFLGLKEQSAQGELF